MSKSTSTSFDELVRKNTPPPRPPKRPIMDRTGDEILARYGPQFYSDYLTALIKNDVPATVLANTIKSMDIETKPTGATVIKEYRNQLRLLVARQESTS